MPGKYQMELKRSWPHKGYISLQLRSGPMFSFTLFYHLFSSWPPAPVPPTLSNSHTPKVITRNRKRHYAYCRIHKQEVKNTQWSILAGSYPHTRTSLIALCCITISHNHSNHNHHTTWPPQQCTADCLSRFSFDECSAS